MLKWRHVFFAASVAMVFWLVPYWDIPLLGFGARLAAVVAAALVFLPMLLSGGRRALRSALRSLTRRRWTRASSGVALPPPTTTGASCVAADLLAQRGDSHPPLAGGPARLEDPWALYGQTPPEAFRRVHRVEGEWVATPSALWFVAPAYRTATALPWAHISKLFVSGDEWPGHRQVYATMDDGRRLMLRIQPTGASTLRAVARQHMRREPDSRLRSSHRPGEPARGAREIRQTEERRPAQPTSG